MPRTLNGVIVGDYIFVSHGTIETMGTEGNPSGVKINSSDVRVEFTASPAMLFVRDKAKKLDLAQIIGVTHSTMKGYHRKFGDVNVISFDGQEVYVGKDVQAYVESLPKKQR